MAEWQPIEMAPKDGTLILCYGEHGNDGEEHENRYKYSLMWWWGKEFDQGYWTDNYYEAESQWQLIPTHWTPLPEPPNAP